MRVVGVGDVKLFMALPDLISGVASCEEFFIFRKTRYGAKRNNKSRWNVDTMQDLTGEIFGRITRYNTDSNADSNDSNVY